MTSIVEPYYTSIGFAETQSDPHLEKLSRIDAMNWACRLGVADCVQNSLSTQTLLPKTPNLITCLDTLILQIEHNRTCFMF